MELLVLEIGIDDGIFDLTLDASSTKRHSYLRLNELQLRILPCCHCK